jgi:small subunit ribosomal protein S15
MISKEKKHKIVSEYQRHGSDVGSSDVQIALLTERINLITAHLQNNKKDFSSRRGLLALVNQRRRLLDYLARTEPERYKNLLQRLGLRK